MPNMGLPEDPDITGLEPQDQEILLSNHRPVPLSFIPFYIETLATIGRAPRGEAECFPYGYPIATGPLGGRNHGKHENKFHRVQHEWNRKS